jgi:hypothetical protein
MISYTSSFINEYYQSLENKTLDAQLLDSLNSILTTINNDMSLNTIENEYEFRFKKTKSKSKSNDYYYQQQQSASFNTFNSVRCQKKKEETKTQIEVVKSTLKSILNKLSPSNYTKLENDLIILYTQLHDSCMENNNNEDIHYIDTYIINYICYNNVSYSNIYVNILFTLFNIYYNKNYKLETSHIYNLLQTHYNDFLTFDNIIKNKTPDLCDEFSVNKHNDKYKCFIILIINLYKKMHTIETLSSEKTVFFSEFFLTHSSMSLLILHFNQFFIKNLELENNKDYCETIQEFLIILYNELLKEGKFIKTLDCDLKIINDIKFLLLNSTNYPSYTTKIKFKLMNIRDKYEALV